MGSDVARWWAGPAGEAALLRFVGDLVAGEMARLRPGSPSLLPQPWNAATRIDTAETGMGADSMELVSLAAGLAEAVELHKSGIEDRLLARRTLGGWVETARAGLERHADGLIFRTSGATGAPKPCRHELAGLVLEVEAGLAPLFGGAGRVLSAVPSHHIYGFLFTILLPRALGGLAVVDLRGGSPAALAAIARPGDLVVAHPAWWSAAARAGGRVPAGVIGVTSTAPCPAATVRTLTTERGLARIVEIYGSSETAGVGWRDDPEAQFELFPHLRRGEAWEDLLPDHLAWTEPRRFSPVGRKDAAVQVGGSNVFPARVAAVLERHPAVAAAAVRLMNPAEGDRLKAFIVLRGGLSETAELRSDLDRWIATLLSVPERPRALTFGSACPVGLLGKPADW